MFKNRTADEAVVEDRFGRIFALPDDEMQTNPRASVQHFQAASPQPHIDMLKQIAQMFSGETKIRCLILV